VADPSPLGPDRRSVLTASVAAASAIAGLAGCSDASGTAAPDGNVVTVTTTPGQGPGAGPSSLGSSPDRLRSDAAVLATSVSARVGVPYDRPLWVSVHGGRAGDHLESVSLTREGEPLSGAFDSSRRTWTAGQLVPGSGYVLTAVLSGTSSAWRRSFTTASPTRTLRASIVPSNEATVGVGMPVVVSFNHPVHRRAAVERALTVATTSPVTGAWRWSSDRSVTFRPATYWPANTRVRIGVALAGVDAGGGVWGVADLTPVHFSTGDAVISRVDLTAHQLTVAVNGAVVRTIPGDRRPTRDDDPQRHQCHQPEVRRHQDGLRDRRVPEGVDELLRPPRASVTWSRWSGAGGHSSPVTAGRTGTSAGGSGAAVRTPRSRSSAPDARSDVLHLSTRPGRAAPSGDHLSSMTRMCGARAGPEPSDEEGRWRPPWDRHRPPLTACRATSSGCGPPRPSAPTIRAPWHRHRSAPRPRPG